MFSTEFLLKLLKLDYIAKVIYTVLFISLLTVVDFFTLFIFSDLIGIYLYLGIITSITLFGVFIIIKLSKSTIKQLESKHNVGVYPEYEFYKLTALLFASLLIIFPGIITSIIGFILIIPHFRQFIGRSLTKKLKLDWHGVYEYKEIYEK
ncbi:MAG: hypothetical protein B6229_03595 [Spirochaetaceae bacterium 4572_7]|nr:MAG: hypothetical protein B6229_03595 [Spirochaetaceae bacterium 4572_7]